jgi:5-deoxy-glucuronate isomerase
MLLADTLYRVPRERGLHVIQRRGPRQAQWLTSRRLILEPGERASFRSADEETVVVLQEGSGTFEAGGRKDEVSRSSVFAEPATALFVPPAVDLVVTARTRLEAVLVSAPSAPSARTGAPALVGPGQVKINPRGRADYAREVHDLFVDDEFAERLMVGETFNPPGHWSSYPPHKHDGAHGEVRLEEVYHFRIDPPNGFAHQSLYTDTGESVVHSVRDGDAVMLPYGYHPVSAPPGYRVYYLWALAGERRHLAPYEDPQHKWIHTAQAMEVDHERVRPRVP